MILDAIHSTAIFGDCSEVNQITAIATPVKVLDQDINRVGAVIVNDSNSVVYIRYGAGITSTNYTWRLNRNDILLVDDYRGDIYALWENVNGQLIITNYYR